METITQRNGNVIGIANSIRLTLREELLGDVLEPVTIEAARPS
jgi:hypothetical protein